MGTGDKLILGNKHPYIEELLDTEEVVERVINKKRDATIVTIQIIVALILGVSAIVSIVSGMIIESSILQCLGWVSFVSALFIPAFIEAFTYDWVWSKQYSYTKYLVKIDYYIDDGDQAQKKVVTSGFTYTVLEQVSENVCWVKQEERKEERENDT